MDWYAHCPYAPERKRCFHAVARARPRALAAELRLLAGSYDLRSNMGGIAVSGEIILHHERVYVQVSQGGGLIGAGAAGLAVAIDAVRVGPASWTNDLALRRSWTRTPAASAARSVMGTMSVDFMVMGDCRRSCRKSPNHVFHADRKWMIPATSGARPPRWAPAHRLRC